MCLIVLAWQRHPDYPLVLAANRDEYHARAADPMGWWPDRPSLLAGRDLQAGGTWLGVTRGGRVAAVTNYRENGAPTGELSRGEIVADFAAARSSPSAYLEAIDGKRYAGFSAIAATRGELAYRSNRGDKTRALDPGIYGLSNASLDTPWPKLVRSRERLQVLLEQDAVLPDDLLDLLADRTQSGDDDVAALGLPFKLARELSAPFVAMPDYGTRCTTVVICRADGHIEIVERRFGADGAATGESRFVFLAPDWMPVAGQSV